MKILFSAITTLLFLYANQVSALDLTEGEWELEVKQTVSGMPVANPPISIRECFTEADPIPTSFLNARSCHVMEQRVRHRTVYYKVNCFTEHGSVINEGKIRFGNFKITGSSKTDLGDVAIRGKAEVIKVWAVVDQV